MGTFERFKTVSWLLLSGLSIGFSMWFSLR
jgi:hypothetical protein